MSPVQHCRVDAAMAGAATAAATTGEDHATPLLRVRRDRVGPLPSESPLLMSRLQQPRRHPGRTRRIRERWSPNRPVSPHQTAMFYPVEGVDFRTQVSSSTELEKDANTAIDEMPRIRYCTPFIRTFGRAKNANSGIFVRAYTAHSPSGSDKHLMWCAEEHPMPSRPRHPESRRVVFSGYASAARHADLTRLAKSSMSDSAVSNVHIQRTSPVAASQS